VSKRPQYVLCSSFAVFLAITDDLRRYSPCRCLQFPTSRMTSKDSQILRWSEIDKVHFFGVGTVMYSALTIALHPTTVLKTRQQVLNTTAKDSLLHQHTLRSTYHDLISQSGVRGLFRGAGVVVSLAIPARVVYVSVLEWSRHQCNELFTVLVHRFHVKEEKQSRFLVPLVASVSGGIAGGLAAISITLQCMLLNEVLGRSCILL
jgi:Mitochondrial carrier protein